MKTIKYKCINPNDKYDVSENSYTCEEWKAISLGWFNQNNQYALATNMRALKGQDVLTFLKFSLDLKFEAVQT